MVVFDEFLGGGTRRFTLSFHTRDIAVTINGARGESKKLISYSDKWNFRPALAHMASGVAAVERGAGPYPVHPELADLTAFLKETGFAD